MAQVNIPMEPAPGVIIDQNDGKITITITTTPTSNDSTVKENSESLWHAAYASLRTEHPEELDNFEKEAQSVFRPLQRSKSSNLNAFGRSTPGWHNMSPKAVVGAVKRWVFESQEEEPPGEDEDEAERDKAAALSSTKISLSKSIQDSPSAHLAWAAASLCIHKLAEGDLPDTSGLAYIVSRIAFYDRLSRLVFKTPEDDENNETNDKTDDSFHKILVALYTAVLKQLIIVLVLSHGPHETRAQQQKQMSWDNAGIKDTAAHSVISLESSISQHVRDKELEESITNLVRLSAQLKDLNGRHDQDAEGAADTKMGDDKDSCDSSSDDNDNNDDDDDDYDDDDENYDPNEIDKKESDDGSVKDTKNSKRSKSVKSAKDDDMIPAHSKVQKLLCGTPVQPPSLPPRPPQPEFGLPDVLASLHNWAQEQEAYRQWHHARSLGFSDSPSGASEGVADQDGRILWVHGKADGSTTLLLQALVEAEEKSESKRQDGGLPRHAVAHAFWNWSRDVDGTSVVSVVRDIVWNVLITQPALQDHLVDAVGMIQRSTLLGDGDEKAKAWYAAQGTSCDFYAMLAVLCRIVRDTRFEPTCFVVDYMDALLGDDDDLDDVGEAHKSGSGGPSRAAQKRTWTLQDLIRLVQTTCRLSGKVAWIVASSSSSPAMGDVLASGNHLQLKPNDPKLDEIMSCYAQALLRDQCGPAHKPAILSQLGQELIRKTGSNVAGMHLAVDLLGAVRLPWNALHILQRLPDSSEGLGAVSEWIVQNNVGDGVSVGVCDNARDSASDRAHLDAVLYTAALAFRPLTIAELGALADLPATVNAGILVDVLGRPLLDMKKVDLGGGEPQSYIYFSSRALLASQRKRLAQGTAAPDLHAGMVRRHLRCLSSYYGNSDRGELSLYMKLAWLRHLDRVETCRKDDNDDTDSPLAKDMCNFVEQHGKLWLRDLETLHILFVARRLLQDLLPLAADKRQLSPMQAALQSMLACIVRQQATSMSLDDMDCFLRMAGHKTIDINVHDDLPVVPQGPPMPLPELLALDSPEVADAAASVGTLDGHSDWVRDTKWTYDGRLIVSISDDYTLRCWDRASCRVQHVTKSKLTEFPKQLCVSATDPTIIIALASQSVVLFDLAIGTVPVKIKSNTEVMEERQALLAAQEKQEDGQKASQQASQQEQGEEDGDEKDVDDGKSTNDANGNDAKDAKDPSDVAIEELILFSDTSFAMDGSNDLVITCNGDGKEAQKLVFCIPEFRLKEVRNVALGYKSFPSALMDAVQESECKDAVLADDVGLAAVVDNKGNVVFYDSKLATQTQTIRWTERKFVSVEYVALWRVFIVFDTNNNMTCHFVHEPEGQGDRGATEPVLRPLIQTYKVPESSCLSYSFGPRREEAIYTYRYKPTMIYKVIEEEAVVVNGPTDSTDSGDAPARRPSPFTSTILSHNGLRTATAKSDGQVQLWNLPSTTAGPHAASAATSEAATSDPTLWCTMAETSSEVNWLSFSHDDSMLVACYDNRQAEVWDTDTGERVAVLDGHSTWLHFAAFSPNDALVVTASSDGEVRLWDLNASRELYLETKAHLARAGYLQKDEDDKDDKDEANVKETDKNTDSVDTPVGPLRRTFVTLKGEEDDSQGTIAFSPDGRFLVTSGHLGHIFDISPPSGVESLLPIDSLEPCANLVWEDVTKKKKGKANAEKKKDQENRTQVIGNDNDNNNDVDVEIGGDGEGDQDDGCAKEVVNKDDGGDGNGEDESNDDDDDNEEEEDEEEDDDDDDNSDNLANMRCNAFTFSPESRSLVGFCTDGQLFLWKFTASSWQPQAIILAGGFKAPGRPDLWIRFPRQLSMSGTDGQYLLHTEIGVWALPPPPTDDNQKENKKIGLQASAHHPCNISHTPTHMAIFWQDQLLAKLPKLYTPSKPYSFSSYTCDIHSEEGGTSTLVIGTKSGRLCCFRFRGKKDLFKST
ncbi:putative WD repeat-containing protein [Trichoderma ghanense]|uniref:WD repeat-containing protein n=1 Tax=Trichoderma ghanense TaxID=65468 RepID=A0ABY2GQB8_9HYPO